MADECLLSDPSFQNVALSDSMPVNAKVCGLPGSF